MTNLKSTIQRSKIFTLGILLLLFGLIAGAVISDNMRVSLGAIKGWFIVPLLFFIMARDVLDTEAKKEKALWSLALSGGVVAVVGFFYWIFGSVTFDGRLKAFYESPNMLAMYLAPAFLVVMQALKSKVKVESFKLHVLVLGLVFLIFSLFLTRSIGAIIGISAALLLYYLYTAFWNGRRKIQYTLFFIIVFAGIALPFFSLFVNPWEIGRNSLASRAMVWQASAEILKDNWLFGIGPGMFQEHYLAEQKNHPPYLEWAVPHPHNIFLAAWLYAGLLGFIGFLFVMFWFFRKSIPASCFLQAASLSIIFYLLIHGAIDNTLWRQDMAMVFWLLFAVI